MPPPFALPYAPTRSYDYGPSSTLGELLRLQGLARARGREAQGQLSGQLWSGIGNQVGQTLGRLTQFQLEAPARAREAEWDRLRLEEARDTVQTRRDQRAQLTRQQAAFVGLLDKYPAGDVPVEEVLTIYGPTASAPALQALTAMRTLAEGKVKDEKAAAVTLGTMFKALKDPALQQAFYPRVKPYAVKAGLVDAHALPEAFTPAIVDALIAWGGGQTAAKLHNVPPGHAVISETNPQAGPVYTAPAAPEHESPVSYQSKVMLLDGRRVPVGYNPRTNTYHYQGQDVTARVQDPPPEVDPTLQAIRSATLAAVQSGQDPRKIATFNQITGQYQRSPLVLAADRTLVLSDAIKAIEKNPADPAAQLSLAYSYVQALDTYQSAVREGELQNLGILGTRLQEWATQLNRVAFEGAFLNPDVAKNIAANAKQLVSTIRTGQARKQQEFASRARVSGVGDLWDQFVGGLAPQSDGPQVGDEKTFPNGRKGRYDGTGWVPIN